MRICACPPGHGADTAPEDARQPGYANVGLDRSRKLAHSFGPMSSEASGHRPLTRSGEGLTPLAQGLRLLAPIGALIAILLALWQLFAASNGLDIRRTQLGNTPVSVFRLPGARRPRR